jgi:hypothetical protein
MKVIGEVHRMQIEMAWRDERVNVFALCCVSVGVAVDPLLFVCKKRPIGHAGPFLLDACKGHAGFELSRIGMQYQAAVSQARFPLRYVAEVDCYLRIPVAYEVFTGLCAEEWFGLWRPSAPMAYFDGLHEGYLAVLRVSSLPEEVPDALLRRGRAGANFYYALEHPVTVAKVRPVLTKRQFNRRKQELTEYLSSHGWLLGEEKPGVSLELDAEGLFDGLEQTKTPRQPRHRTRKKDSG